MMETSTMSRVVFTSNLSRHLPTPELSIGGATLAQVLDGVFSVEPVLRGYVMDDQGHVRQHVAIFVDGAQLADRGRLDVPVRGDSEIYVLQALSGG
jgi:hypothetical protein